MGWWPGNKVGVRTAEKAVSLIRNRNFARLWGSQVLSQVAQNLLNFALVIRVFDLAQHTRFANISVALLILSFGIPSIFFPAAAGVSACNSSPALAFKSLRSHARLSNCFH